MARGRFESLTLDQLTEWQSVLETVGETEAYYRPEYVQAFEMNGDGTGEMFVYRHPHGTVLLPAMVRPIAIHGRETGYWDVASVYGYGGPLIYGSEAYRDEIAMDFVDDWRRYCASRKIVSEFVRFHPLLKNHEPFLTRCPLEAIRETIYVDLRSNLDTLWTNSIMGRTRTAIRKAERAGVEVLLGQGEEFSANFERLYLLTMGRLESSSYYRFSPAFFRQLQRTVLAMGTFVEARYQGQPIASIVLLRGSRFLHYHLSGSDPNHRSIPGNALLLFEAIKWGSAQGLEALHLGGGYSGDQDNLFQFKASFSPLRAKYYVGKFIHLPEAYDTLVSERFRQAVNVGYFPQYRQG